MAPESIYQPLPDPLNSMRLLCVEPGWPSDQLRVGLLVVHNRQEAPPYDALSYVWGTKIDSNAVICNGMPKQVTASLGDALRAFRPLPTNGDPHDHGVDVMDKSHLLHSTRNAWSDFAVNRSEKSHSERSRPLWIWIDALCINQDDLQERSSQVGCMRDIYSSAQMVRIWLGQQLQPVSVPPPSNSAVDKLLKRARLAEYGEMPVVLSFIAQALRNRKITPKQPFGIGFPARNQPEWGIVRKLFEQSWFYRVWTVQEAVMAQKGLVIVGDWEMDWKAFSKATIWLTEASYSISINFRFPGPNFTSLPKDAWQAIPLSSALYMCEIGQTVGRRPQLLDLLIKSRERAATQPQDHVFAVLALAIEFFAITSSDIHVQDEFRQTMSHAYMALQPDYGKPVGEVFRDSTSFIILLYESLQALTESEFVETGTIPGCPTWTPNWSRPRRSLRLSGYATYNADMGEKMDRHLKADKSELCVGGLSVDKVVSITKVLETSVGEHNLTWRYEPLPEELDFVSAAWDLAQHLFVEGLSRSSSRTPPTSIAIDARSSLLAGFRSPYRTRDEILAAFIYTVTCNCNHEEPDYTKLVQENHAFLWISHYFGSNIHNGSVFQRVKHQFSEAFDHGADRIGFQTFLTSTCTWRRFFITRNGYMGIGPMSMEEGDHIVVLFGSRVPFVVRPVKNGELSRFMLVGECYVHGVMDGEAVERWKQTGLEKENFVFI